MAKLKRNDLQSLARAHIKAALLLLDGGAYAGAYYFVGLAVECAIKACIARATEEASDMANRLREYGYSIMW
jgi:HEPN domain-containing protein